jgi:endonuclease III
MDRAYMKELSATGIMRIPVIQSAGHNNHYRLPLQQLPGVGPKTVEKLIKSFYNEIQLMKKP